VSREGVRRSIDFDVLMASAAIPFIFPATRVDGRHYGDGSMRQLAPISPAVHLGANRVLVIGTRGQPAPLTNEQAVVPPSPGHLLGFVLDALFTDGLSIDLERMRQINRLLQIGIPGQEKGWRPIETCVIQPSEDPTAIARRHVQALPRTLRTLLRTIGALEARGGLLVSYLLFDGTYTRELMALGYEDARQRRDEIERYLEPTFRAGAQAREK
jgi:NTE family protein